VEIDSVVGNEAIDLERIQPRVVFCTVGSCSEPFQIPSKSRKMSVPNRSAPIMMSMPIGYEFMESRSGKFESGDVFPIVRSIDAIQ